MAPSIWSADELLHDRRLGIRRLDGDVPAALRVGFQSVSWIQFGGRHHGAAKRGSATVFPRRSCGGRDLGFDHNEVPPGRRPGDDLDGGADRCQALNAGLGPM